MLLLIRHGESTANAAGLLVGRADAPLTAAGRRQAAALGSILGSGSVPVTTLISSPLRRALDTAQSLGLGVPVTIDHRWVEVDYGEEDLRPLDQIGTALRRHWQSGSSFRPAGGETLHEVGERVRAACAELFARDGEGARRAHGAVAVVSHVSPIKAAVAWALGADDDLAWRLHLATGSLTVIGWSEEHPVLETFNAVPPLTGAMLPPRDPDRA